MSENNHYSPYSHLCGKSVEEVLRAARSLLSDECRWTKGAHARSPLGLPVDACHPMASCYCLQGAITRAAGGTTAPGCEGAISEVEGVVARALSLGFTLFSPSQAFNDDPETTHEQVLAVLDEAIEGVGGK